MTRDATSWLAEFHAGRRAAIEQCYRDYARVAFQAAGRLLRPADRDTVVHQVFCQLVADPDFRRSFRGGSFAAWLAQVVARRAIDFRRKYGREDVLDETANDMGSEARLEADLDAKRLVERFRAERLPAELDRLFELRFLRGMSQRDVAVAMDMPRSTVGYQEQRIRESLRDFLRGAT
jgi:RNA polymerase sigma factor (sigma-70 family)